MFSAIDRRLARMTRREFESLQYTIRFWLALIGIGLVLIILAGFAYASQRVAWLGFQDKTLWDLLQLAGTLAVPILVGFVAVRFQAKQSEQRSRETLDNQRELALQKYVDDMADLLTNKQLVPENHTVRNIARVRTLTLLRRLDGERRGTVVQFLYDCGLIHISDPVIDLQDADLRDAQLRDAHLPEVNLDGANLRNAQLEGADLSRGALRAFWEEANLHGAALTGAVMTAAVLRRADLSFARCDGVDMQHARLDETTLIGTELNGANLRDAVLDEADLREAQITTDQLGQAMSLSKTLMPDRTRHE